MATVAASKGGHLGTIGCHQVRANRNSITPMGTVRAVAAEPFLLPGILVAGETRESARAPRGSRDKGMS